MRHPRLHLTALTGLALLASCRGSSPPGAAETTSSLSVPAATRTESGAIARANLDSQIVGLEGHRERRPGDARVLGTLASLYLERARFFATFDDYARADELTRTWITGAPESGDAWLARASVLATLHRFSAAASALARAEAAGAPAVRCQEARAAIELAQGRDASALHRRRAAAARSPDILSLGSLAAAEAAAGDLAAAREHFAEALDRYRGVSAFAVAWLLFRWGNAEHEAGNLEAAAPLYQAARERLPGYVYATGHLAEVAAARGERDRAIALLEELVAGAEHPEFVGLLATLEAERGDARRSATLTARARRGFEALLARHPSAFLDHAARFYLSAGGDPDRALALARANLKLRPTAAARLLVRDALLASID